MCLDSLEAAGNSNGGVPRAQSYFEHLLARYQGLETKQVAPLQKRTRQVEEDGLALVDVTTDFASLQAHVAASPAPRSNVLTFSIPATRVGAAMPPRGTRHRQATTPDPTAGGASARPALPEPLG